MNRADLPTTHFVIELAREAGIESNETGEYPIDGRAWVASFAELECFAAMVAEQCARVAEQTYEGGSQMVDGDSGFDCMDENSARAIREAFPMPTGEP